MNIAVICGGLSSERDVSITSGVNVAGALRKKGHKVVLIDLFYGYEGEYDDPAELFEREQEELTYSVKTEAPDVAKLFSEGDGSRMGKNVIDICRAADICFIALHGADGEDGKLQATFDLYGIRYTGCGYLGSAIAMNKGISKKLFALEGIPTPRSVMLRKGDLSVPDFGFPCVVKPCSGGSSVGVSIAYNREEYEKALGSAFEYEADILVEQYIKGREFTVGVMDGKALPILEIVTKSGWYDYHNKYQPGFADDFCPAPISDRDTERMQSLGEKVGKALKIDIYYRVDIIMDEKDGTMYCLEANTLPGMTPTSLFPIMLSALGMDFPDFCDKIVELSLERYGA